MREQQICELRCAGLNADQISKELYVSDQTIKNTITNIRKKLMPDLAKDQYTNITTAICWHHGYEAALQDIEARISKRTEQSAPGA